MKINFVIECILKFYELALLEDYDGIVKIVFQMKELGYSKIMVINILKIVLQTIEDDIDFAKVESIYAVLDRLSGFCSPGQELWIE